MENDLSMFEITYICGKWLQYEGNGLICGQIVYIFEKLLRGMGNGLSVWETT